MKFLWFKYHSRTRGSGNGKNFVFAGQYPDGSILTNELTYTALEAYEELKNVQNGKPSSFNQPRSCSDATA